MKRIPTLLRWSVAVLALAVTAGPLPLLAQETNPAPETNATVTVTDVITSAETPTASATNTLDNALTNATPANAAETSGQHHGPIVMVGGNATLLPGDSAESVVAIFGSARAHGKVNDSVVAIGGDAEADAEVSDAVVAVGGTAAAKGRVGDSVVAIAGDAEISGHVGDSVVAVVGDITLAPGAVVEGDVVSIGGQVKTGKDAVIKGEIVQVGLGQHPILAPLRGMADWLKYCGLKLRLLAFHASWFWLVPGLFLLFYVLIALALPRPVAACVNELTQRPTTTFLLGLLTKLVVPIILLALSLTGIGVFVVPFVLTAVFIGAAIGKVALFQFLGRQLARLFGRPMPPPLLALLVGAALVTLLYMVPVLSLLVYGVLGLWALGVAVTAAFGRARRETPRRPGPTPTVPPGTTAYAAAAAGTAASGTSETAGAAATDAAGNPIAGEATPGTAVPPPPLIPAAPVPEAYLYPRANFFERMGAAFLDVILISILSAFVGGLPLGFLVALAYFSGMWAWKGTTIGGIVLNLKVVRLDDRPVTFAVALVRGLASSFSVVVFFLGFLWMVFDGEKQTWHDKIAGTVVVRVPRGTSLVCF
ncbi:MAG TPA: RDD family protein [Dongiaceae bacterium]|nr:RDD family protein [Dongiaceae bacterium]